MTKNKVNTSILSGSLVNKCLIALPDVSDFRFATSVVYIFEHGKNGATGLVINKPCSVAFSQVLSQQGIQNKNSLLLDRAKVLWGGPVEQIRGFILHGSDYTGFETTKITEKVSLTATVDVLSDLAKGEGPKDFLLALGKTHWDEGQLELEISANLWFVMDVDDDFLFHCPAAFKWKKGLSKIGIDPLMLSLEQGSV